MINLIVSFICADRSGLVNELSEVVKKHHGNWQASSLHQLSGHFTGAVEVAVAKEHADDLIAALNALKDMTLIIKKTDTGHEKVAPTLVIELTANDRVGIVNEIASVVHHQGGNLLKLVSKQDSAPHTANELFKAKVHIAINENGIDGLVMALEALADDLVVDIAR